MDTKIRKTPHHGEWEATSEATIGETPKGPRILRLRTSKARRGGIDASASVFVREPSNGNFYSEVHVMFGDFSKRGIAPTPCKRVTEKAVAEVHSRALLEMDGLIAEAEAFYAAKAA